MVLGCAVMRVSPWVWVVVVAVAVAGAAAFIVSELGAWTGATASAVPFAGAPSAAVEPVAPPAPRAPTLNERLRSADLVQAVELLKPSFTPQHVGQNPDTGSEALAVWASIRLTWDQLTPLEPTSYAKAKKDPALELGRRICIVNGHVVQILADRSMGIPVYRGLLSYESVMSLLSFVAVGSTGDIVEQSRASFCGVVTGAWEFPNLAGGATQTVHVVGMFNLPENHGLSAEQRIDQR